MHTERDLTGMKVMLEMSPAAKSPAHKPMDKYLVRAGQTDASSFFVLGDPDTIYVLEAPRHEIAPGQRYLVRVAILTEEGLKGKACLVDRIRMPNGEIPRANTTQEASRKSATGSPTQTSIPSILSIRSIDVHGRRAPEEKPPRITDTSPDG